MPDRTGALPHVPTSIRPGDVLAGRYRLEDLLSESKGGRFWRARDGVLDRHVAVHCLAADDPRGPELLDAARRSAAVQDRCILRVLDADQRDDIIFVVNEWGDGASLDIVLQNDGPLDPRHAAWMTSEVGASLAAAHDAGVAHGRLCPENVLLDHNGHVRLIGLGVEAALWGLPQDRMDDDVVDLAAVLYAGLTGRWAGVAASVVPRAPGEHGAVLRPRQVRAGIPRPLDDLCDEVINPDSHVGVHAKEAYDLATARGIADYLRAFVGDGTDLPPVTARLVRRLRHDPMVAAALADSMAGGDLSLAHDDTTEHERVAWDGPTVEETPAVEQTVVAEAVAAEGVAEEVAEGDAEGDAEGIAEEVAEGDAEAGDPEATQAMLLAGAGAAARPGVPDETDADTPDSFEAAADQAPRPTEAGLVEQPTELGMPIFGEDSDDVEWLTARATKPPPPPPFEEHPERPLFAPEPPPGEPARRPRPGAPTPSGEYWPWESSTGTGAPAATTGTGTGAGYSTGSGFGTGSGIYYLDEELPDDDIVPGRRTLRLGMVILATILLVLAVLVALNLFRGRSPLALGPSSSESSATAGDGGSDGSTAGEPLTGLTAYDLDPQADPPEENPDLAPFAVDGDRGTDWHTVTYKQNLGPGGLKTGVGLVVDVGEVRELQDVTVTLVGSPTAVSVFLADDRPSAVRGLQRVDRQTVDGETMQVALDGASGRFVVLWLTSLPEVKGGFRGTIAEVEVTG